MNDAIEVVPISTAPTRSTSRRAQLQRKISALIETQETTAAWSADGFRPDLELLSRILALTDPNDVRGGLVATGLDMWAAATLRTAGLSDIRPRTSPPYYSNGLNLRLQREFDSLDASLNKLETFASRDTASKNQATLRALRRNLTAQLKRVRKEVEKSPGTVLGESRRKQVDVFAADAERGLELLISTKTFALAVDIKELVKNLPNRWEEFDGDLKNLRGRFPLAVIGALTILPSMALKGGALAAFVDMMVKLTAPGRPWVNAYDRSTIIVADWDNATDERVPILNEGLAHNLLPSELQPTEFFDVLIGRLFERAPIAEHQQARMAAMTAKGQDPTELAEAVATLEAALPELSDAEERD